MSSHSYSLLALVLVSSLYYILLSSSLWLTLHSTGASSLFILSFLSPIFGISYFIIYLFALTTLFLISKRLISPLLAFTSLGGLPPLVMFWAKVLVLITLPLPYCFFYLLISAPTFLAYLRLGVSFSFSGASSPVPIFVLCALSLLVFLLLTN